MYNLDRGQMMRGFGVGMKTWEIIQGKKLARKKWDSERVEESRQEHKERQRKAKK